MCGGPGPGPATAAATKGEGGPARVQLDAAGLQEECAGKDSHWNASSGRLCLNTDLASPPASEQEAPAPPGQQR